MKKRPLFLAGFVYLVMTVVSFYAFEAAIGLTLIGVFLLLLQLWKQKEGKTYFIVSAVSVLACLSLFLWQQNAEKQLQTVGETLSLEGLVTDCKIYDSAVFYEADAWLKGQKVALSLWSYDMEAVEQGNRFSAVVTIEEENRRHWNDGSIIIAQVQEMTDLGMEISLKADCLRLRSLLQRRIESLFHGKGEEILLGILLGEKAELSTEVEEVFLKSGSLHLLTVSGFHFTLMAAALFACFKLMQFNPKLCAALCIPFLLVLLLLEGATVSVQRAAVMTALAFLATILERDYDGLSSWGAAVLFILFPEPLRIFGAGFVLSFSAVLGILLVAPILRKEGTRVLALAQEGSLQHRLLKYIIYITAISLSANLLTAPFLLYFFGSFPLLAPLSSLFVVPLLPLIMLFAVAAIICPVGLLSLVLASVVQLLCGVLYRWLSVIADWDVVYYGENNLLLFGLLFFFVLSVLLYAFGTERKQMLVSAAAYLTLLCVALAVQAQFEPKTVTAYACRTSLLLCKDGQAVLIGAPEKEHDFDEIERVFRSEQVETLGLLYLTAQEKLGEVQLLRLIEQWRPSCIVSATEIEALELQNIDYLCNPLETVRFWQEWQVDFIENGAVLSNRERKFLKIHEKYAIMSMYEPEYTAILGDDSMIYGDSSMKWSKTWGGVLTFTLEDRHDSGTGKPASGSNQRG